MTHHPITPLASSQINHDHLKVELVEPPDMPAIVRIVWPPAPTVVDRKRFPDVAAAIAQLFARAQGCWLHSKRSGSYDPPEPRRHPPLHLYVDT
jgi:hypothetical protein